MKVKNLFRLQSYVHRICILPKLLSIFWEQLLDGSIPEKTTCKYDGEFKDIIGRRDPYHLNSLTEDEVYTLYSSVLATKTLDGEMAEVGVYRGGSAKMICEVKGDKSFHLFDTFEGMPDQQINPEKDRWRQGSHKKTSLELIKQYLDDYTNLHFVKGVFPDSIRPYPDLKSKTFCFVHLDVDLYQCTLDALQFFWPRMTKGGRIVSHNYNLSPQADTPGVKEAFFDYYQDKRHSIIEIADTQCMIIKD
jgi:O-methyltransferase